MSVANQVTEFVYRITRGLPWGDLPLKALTDDAERVREEFILFLRNGGRVMVGPYPILNFDVDPFIPNGWEIRPEDQIRSRVTGRFEFNPSKIELHLEPSQKSGNVIRGHRLKDLLEGQPVLPAHVLDHWLEHPELIPDSCKGKVVFFWGTIYRYAGGRLCVRYLDWNGVWWDWNYSRLDYVWSESNPSAVSAS